MTREFALGMMIALGILALAGMAWSIVSRRRRGDSLRVFPPAEVVTGEILASFAVLHVATTIHNTPLERVWTSPLAYRARTTLRIHSDGLSLALRGEGDLGIVGPALVGVSRATWAIDKAVDPEGLIVVSWRHDGTLYDSYFRCADHPAEAVVSPISDLIEKTQEDVA
jgi:hypothetical protein